MEVGNNLQCALIYNIYRKLEGEGGRGRGKGKGKGERERGRELRGKGEGVIGKKGGVRGVRVKGLRVERGDG
jgi:hypothetical protein